MMVTKIHKTILYVFSFFIIVSGGVAFGQDGIIAEIDDSGNGGYLIVNIRGQGTLWVGCTVYPAGHGKYEVDLKPVKVKGYGKAKFNVLPRMNFGEGRLDYVVALWKDKISLRKCEKKYGKGSEDCKWAKRNGFQMEGRLDRKEGTYTSY